MSAATNRGLVTAQNRGRSLVSCGYSIHPGSAPYAYIVKRPANLRDVSGDTVSHYNVSLLPGAESCDCAHFLSVGSREKPCKHLVAVRLHVRAAAYLLSPVADMRDVLDSLEIGD